MAGTSVKRIRLDEEERDLLFQEAGYFSGRVQHPGAQASYRRMQQEAAEGELSEELLEALGELLKVGLTNGRIRTVHGAHAEMAASRLFRRTPQGRALHEGIGQVNEALRALEGQRLESLSISARGPGLYSLTVATNEARLLIAFTPQGVEVRSIEVNL